MYSSRIVLGLVGALVAVAPQLAFGQAHQVSEGRYTLRSSTVESRSISASVARAHGFSPERGLAILNVTVLVKGKEGRKSVPAFVSATAKDLAGVTRDIQLSLDRENGSFSYYGTYHHLPHEVLDLTITATTEGALAPLTLRYRDRLGIR